MTDESFKSLGFHARDTDEFEAFLAELKEATDHHRDQVLLPSEATQALTLLEEDPVAFCGTISVSQHPGSRLYSVPVLAHIAPAEFAKKLCTLDGESQRMVSRALARRYTQGGYARDLVSELDWLRSLDSELGQAQTARVGRISGYRLSVIREGGVQKGIEALSPSH